MSTAPRSPLAPVTFSSEVADFTLWFDPDCGVPQIMVQAFEPVEHYRMETGPETRLVMSKELAREIFNWLGVYLHTR